MSYDILTPCHQCGRLIYVPYAMWDILKSKTDSNKDSNNVQMYQSNTLPSLPIRQKVNFVSFVSNEINESTDQNDILQSKDIKNLRCIQLFQDEKRKETFKTSNTVYFPLCQDCTITYNFHLRNFKKLYEKSSFFIDSKLKSVPKGVFQIQYDNAISPFSKYQLKTPNPSSCNLKFSSRLSVDSEDSILDQKVVIKQHNQIKNLHESINFDDSNKTALPTKSFCPLYSFSIFRIGTNKHYGTINDLRVGFYEYSPNSALETNLALYNMTHLIYTLQSALCIDKINILLATQPLISLNLEINNNNINDENQKKEKKTKKKQKNQNKNSEEKEKESENSEDKSDISEESNVFRLVLPEINQSSLNNNKQVIISKISKKKYSNHYYSNINNAINALFVSFVLIDNASSCLPKYSKPFYNVNLKNRTIGNISYIFDWKNIENWTLAMRMLLFNLKKIQVIFIRSYFCH